MHLLVAFTPQITVEDFVDYNCSCDDTYQRVTLADMRTQLLTMMGYAAQLASIPPGIVALYNLHLQLAQEMLFRRYHLFRTERFFTWEMAQGVRFYDLDANADLCAKKLDPRKVTWVGISQDGGTWRPLRYGIDPTLYTLNGDGIPWCYEIRQCIEVFPPPSDASWRLRIKGYFELLPFAADGDYTTIDPYAILLMATANLKARVGASDAGNYMQMLTGYIGDLAAGTASQRRFFPGSKPMLPNQVLPKGLFT